MQQRERRKQKSHREYRIHICFPCVCFNHSSLYLVCRSAYLRQCDENKVAVSAWLCCLGAFLSFFSEGFFFHSPSLVVRTRMSHHRQAPQRKKKSLCSQPAKVVIDGRLNKNSGRKAHFLPSFGKQKPLSYWKKSAPQLAQHFCCIQMCVFSSVELW